MDSQPQENRPNNEASASLSVTPRSAKWLGHNEPNSRGLMQDLGQSVATGAQYTLTADEALIVYLALARFHDLEDYGYSRDWEGIEAYCPIMDGATNIQGQTPEVEIRTDGTLPNTQGVAAGPHTETKREEINHE